MSQKTEESVAQFVDRFLQRCAGGVLLIGLAYALSAVMYLVSNETADTLNNATVVLGILAVALILPMFVRMVRLRSSGQCDWSESDSYMSSVFNKACVSAFEVTFILLIILEPLSKRVLTDQPADFFINVVVAVAATVLGLAFFYRMQRDDDAIDDDLENEH